MRTTQRAGTLVWPSGGGGRTRPPSCPGDQVRVQVGRALRRDSSWTRTLYRDLSPQDRPAQRNGTKCVSPAPRSAARPPPAPAYRSYGGRLRPLVGLGRRARLLESGGRSALSPTAQLSVPADPAIPLLGKHAHRHTGRMMEMTCVHGFHQMNKQSQVSTMEITSCHAAALGVLAPVPSSAPWMWTWGPTARGWGQAKCSQGRSQEGTPEGE